MPPRHHEFEIDRSSARPSDAPELKPGDERDLLPLFALVWMLCAASVVVALVSRSFDVRATASLAGLVLLPLMVRKTLVRLAARTRR